MVLFFGVKNRFFLNLFTDSAEMVGILQNHAKLMQSVHIHMDASLMNFSTKSKTLNYLFIMNKNCIISTLFDPFSQTLQVSG